MCKRLQKRAGGVPAARGCSVHSIRLKKCVCSATARYTSLAVLLHRYCAVPLATLAAAAHSETLCGESITALNPLASLWFSKPLVLVYVLFGFISLASPFTGVNSGVFFQYSIEKQADAASLHVQISQVPAAENSVNK